MDTRLLSRFSDVMQHWGWANQANRSAWGYRAIAIIRVAAVLGGFVGFVSHIHYAVTSWMRDFLGSTFTPCPDSSEQLQQQFRQLGWYNLALRKKHLEKHIVDMTADEMWLLKPRLFSAFQQASSRVSVAKKFQSAQIANEGFKASFSQMKTWQTDASSFMQSLKSIAEGRLWTETDYFGGSALEQAVVYFQNPQFVEAILEDPAGRKLLDLANQENQTPLVCAIGLPTDTYKEMLKRLELIQTLLRYNPDVNLTDLEGRTPLFAAITRHNNEPGFSYEDIPLTVELLCSNAVIRCVDGLPQPRFTSHDWFDSALIVLLSAYVQIEKVKALIQECFPVEASDVVLSYYIPETL
jgi:hypothetical protein